MRVLFASAECAPLTQVGGLGDVVGALPLALRAQGVDVKVALPLYPFLRKRRELELERVTTVAVPYDGRSWKVGVFSSGDGRLLLFEQRRWIASFYEGPFDRYGFADQHLRFGFFCAAVTEWLARTDWQPDIVHCHDHHTGLIPVMLKARLGARERPRTVLTVHNAWHQGSFNLDALAKAPSRRDNGVGPLPKPSSPRGRFVNFLQRGVRGADFVTTVSPTYARELTRPGGHGLATDFARKKRERKFVGVLNGIDVARWNPRTDALLPRRFDARHLDVRARLKAQLQRAFDLPTRTEVLLLVMVARLSRQKGILLLLSALADLLSRNVQLIVCGDGADVGPTLAGVAAYAPQQVAYAPFSVARETLCYGGGDAFLMPSRFEPCGLTQMKAMRYGCIPVARATGGLCDTVTDATRNPGEGTGFLFRPYSPAALLGAVDRALSVWQQPRRWQTLQRRAMAQDFSWDRSARTYRLLYERLLGKG